MKKDLHSFSDVWKSFDSQPLTHSMAHYLLAISELRHERGYARITDVAKRLGITKGAASIALKAMREKKFIKEDENRMLFLTQRGIRAAKNISGSRAALLKFIHEVLGIEENIALEDACKIEHLISRTTTDMLVRFTRFIVNNPLGYELISKFKCSRKSYSS